VRAQARRAAARRARPVRPAHLAQHAGRLPRRGPGDGAAPGPDGADRADLGRVDQRPHRRNDRRRTSDERADRMSTITTTGPGPSVVSRLLASQRFSNLTIFGLLLAIIVFFTVVTPAGTFFSNYNLTS